VKLGALMSSTGKSEIMASIFAIASNDFITEHHDEDTRLEVPANQPATTEDGLMISEKNLLYYIEIV
jgi:hypothetical protein